MKIRVSVIKNQSALYGPGARFRMDQDATLLAGFSREVHSTTLIRVTKGASQGLRLLCSESIERVPSCC